MADSVIKITDQIIGKSLIGAEALFDELRDLIAKELQSAPTDQILLGSLRAILERTQPMLIEHLRDTDLAAWIAGMDEVYKQFPSWLVEEFTSTIRSLPPRPPLPPNRFQLFGMFGDDEPRLRFPLIEKAAETLAETNILTRDQWDAASQAARDRAFTITGNVTADTIEKVRNELVSDIEQGTSLGSFKNRIAGLLDESGIGPARVELIYRNGVQGAFSDGKETLANNPVVRDVFPYRAYLAVHDARGRETHRMLETLGLSNTNVYRSDDPFWKKFLPPWDHNCRCGDRFMTVEAAARAGVQEAIRWLESGRPPERPEWRVDAIPFEPNPNFSRGGRVGVFA